MNFYKPSNPEKDTERELYFDTLVKADQLGERLATKARPVASDIFYRISEQAIIAKLALPPELPSYMVAAVRIEISEKNQDDDFSELGTIADTTVVIEFDDDSECRIPVTTGDSGQDITYSLLPSTITTTWYSPTDPETKLPAPLIGTITREKLSDIIARTVLPEHDPSLADYTRLDIEAAREAIKQTLDEAEHAEVDKVLHYEIQGIRISVASYNGVISEVDIERTDPSMGSGSIALRTELDHNSHRQEIVVYEANSDPRPRKAFSDEIAYFNATMTKLIAYFDIETESYEVHVDTARRAGLTEEEADEERREGHID